MYYENSMTQPENLVAIGSLTESLEDYLEIIYQLVQNSKIARVRDIAIAKDVKTSSVTSALNRLAKEGLVDYQAREYVDLTDKGREFAFRIHQRHTFLKRFLVELLQVDEKTAEQDACSLEHAISLTTLERMASFIEFITYCPRVSPTLLSDFRDCWLHETQNPLECKDTIECGIWKEKNKLSAKLGINRLSELEQGASGYVARIIGPDDQRKSLIQRGLLPPASILVQRILKDGSIEIIVSGEEKLVSSEEAQMVYAWISKDSISITSGETLPTHRLSQLEPGNSFIVESLTAKGEIRQRLLDMGFIKGSTGKMVREALLKDPIEIEINGYYLSLRRAEASEIIVERSVA